jgi:hypothetical protein
MYDLASDVLYRQILIDEPALQSLGLGATLSHPLPSPTKVLGSKVLGTGIERQLLNGTKISRFLKNKRAIVNTEDKKRGEGVKGKSKFVAWRWKKDAKDRKKRPQEYVHPLDPGEGSQRCVDKSSLLAKVRTARVKVHGPLLCDEVCHLFRHLTNVTTIHLIPKRRDSLEDVSGLWHCRDRSIGQTPCFLSTNAHGRHLVFHNNSYGIHEFNYRLDTGKNTSDRPAPASVTFIPNFDPRRLGLSDPTFDVRRSSQKLIVDIADTAATTRLVFQENQYHFQGLHSPSGENLRTIDYLARYIWQVASGISGQLEVYGFDKSVPVWRARERERRLCDPAVDKAETTSVKSEVMQKIRWLKMEELDIAGLREEDSNDQLY